MKTIRTYHKSVSLLLSVFYLFSSCAKIDPESGDRCGFEAPPSKGRFFTLFPGSYWSNRNITASFMPDGTLMLGGYSSSLFAELNAIAPTHIWQREFARALQTWAEVANINFHLVADDGSAQGPYGVVQGDSRFGDIRLGARPDGSNVLAIAKPPDPGPLDSNSAGDIRLNSERTYSIGSHPDVFTVLLHESGHSLGLDHSFYGTVMYGAITGVYTILSADDIAGIQAIYGARIPDTYDAAASANDSISSATSLALDSSGNIALSADLTTRSDVDYYRLDSPTSFDGTLSASMDARNLSLVAPKVSVYNAEGNLLATASSAFGTVATVNISGLSSSENYYVMADGATNDVFGVGAYVLKIQFGGVTVPPPPPPDTIPPVVSISSPLSGMSVSGIVSVQASASDNVGVTKVELYVDGIVKNSLTVDTTQLANGPHTLIAKAYDAAGNVGISPSVSISVTNVVIDTTPPSVSITSPAGGSSVPRRSSVIISANASDNVAVARVEIYVNNSLICTDTASPYACNWSVPGGKAGKSYQIQAKAYDAANNMGSSAIITVKSQ